MSDATAKASTRRFVVSLLDPRTAPRVPGGKGLGPTLYVRDRLMVRLGDGSDASGESVVAAAARVSEALNEFGYELEGLGQDSGNDLSQDSGHKSGHRSGNNSGDNSRNNSGKQARGLYGAAQPISVGGATVGSYGLKPLGDQPAPPADAWALLQSLRAKDRNLARSVSLEHIVRTCGSYWHGLGGTWNGTVTSWQGISGGWDPISGGWDPISGGWDPISGGWDPISGQVLREYSVPGRGGRAPVSVAFNDPSLGADELSRHPVVAIPDSGLGRHPWYDYTTSDARSRFGAHQGKILRRFGIGLGHEADRDIHLNEFTAQPGPLVGHGTFIAGIVRQGCPQAVLFPVPVIDELGVAAENDVLVALEQLRDLHQEGQRQRTLQPDLADDLPPGEGDDVRAYVLDVLTLSIGYYPEAIDDDDDTLDHDDAEDLAHLLGSPMARLLRSFGELGVLVVAGVGNGATTNRFLPAALAPSKPAAAGAPTYPEGTPLPIIAVGALNPNRTTVAMFSNGGPHVTALRPGVSVVSTMPLFNAGAQASHEAPAAGTGTAGTAATAGTAGTAAMAVTAGPVRSTVDLDDYTQGFGVWTGTSFAAPMFAADFVAELVRGGADLSDTSSAAMLARGWAALGRLLEPAEEKKT